MTRPNLRPPPPLLLPRPAPSARPPSHPREDSSLEPAAFRPSFWASSAPPSSPRLPSLPPRPVQLSPGLSPSLRSALPQPKPRRPAQPSLDDLLSPPPPPPPPASRPLHKPSDLSVASTRAELEPLAVRDLRRVTAPPALMDPWAYHRPPHPALYADRLPKSPAVPTHRPRFVKSASATNIVTHRLSDVRAARRERWSVISDADRDRRPPARPRWFRAFRPARGTAATEDDLQDLEEVRDDPDPVPVDDYAEYDAGGVFRLHRLGRFERALGARGGMECRVPVPDRLHDTPLGPLPVRQQQQQQPQQLHQHHHHGTGKDTAESVLSALTTDSDERVRPRAMSESGAAVQRRSSFVAGKERMLGVWGRLFRRRGRRGSAAGGLPRTQSHREGLGMRRSGKLTRLRSGDRVSGRT